MKTVLDFNFNTVHIVFPRRASAFLLQKKNKVSYLLKLFNVVRIKNSASLKLALTTFIKIEFLKAMHEQPKALSNEFQAQDAHSLRIV